LRGFLRVASPSRANKKPPAMRVDDYFFDISNIKCRILGGGKTELVLTPLRACWLWNATAIDLSFSLKISNTRLIVSAEAPTIISRLTTTPAIPSGVELVHFIFY
ncbi:hypothetical protein, partial [Lapidilactobacillus gannanensis]|uniref:hypothetical protein n=1 Tax=Lapidilactobacillus gannanensis TaxID=2486002 RepID=UPI001CDC25C2